MQSQKKSTNDKPPADERQRYLKNLASVDAEVSFCGEEDPGAALEFLMREDIGETDHH